ncbi:hypothetical protein [Winogradskyella haliclonae]|uniref:Uncharacterized protein n=1 Tax=Winogradskyella haliclonae TaxID=2048558 RepID=A0ABQ2BXZ1_9FLAO|nr:hypothetical protein [Winogradskyella haliclonae]GGI57345.1 hypothetical protein GCM10011444_16540 [Winogradskyella haliclonae]
MGLKIVYVANIIVAGWIGITSLFYPKTAANSIFETIYGNSEYIRLIGALWLSISVLSVFGLFKPENFSPVLIMQLIYKGSWLLVVALPAIINGASYPKGMASFFLVWVIVLPFVIPWKSLFAN